MAKKVLVLLGSPRRKGNSAILAEQITKGAKSGKAKVETIYLHGRLRLVVVVRETRGFRARRAVRPESGPGSRVTPPPRAVRLRHAPWSPASASIRAASRRPTTSDGSNDTRLRARKMARSRSPRRRASWPSAVMNVRTSAVIPCLEATSPERMSAYSSVALTLRIFLKSAEAFG